MNRTTASGLLLGAILVLLGTSGCFCKEPQMLPPSNDTWSFLPDYQPGHSIYEFDESEDALSEPFPPYPENPEPKIPEPEYLGGGFFGHLEPQPDPDEPRNEGVWIEESIPMPGTRIMVPGPKTGGAHAPAPGSNRNGSYSGINDDPADFDLSRYGDPIFDASAGRVYYRDPSTGAMTDVFTQPNGTTRATTKLDGKIVRVEIIGRDNQIVETTTIDPVTGGSMTSKQNADGAWTITVRDNKRNIISTETRKAPHTSGASDGGKDTSHYEKTSRGTSPFARYDALGGGTRGFLNTRTLTPTATFDQVDARNLASSDLSSMGMADADHSGGDCND